MYCNVVEGAVQCNVVHTVQCTVAKSVMQYSAMYLRVHIIECNVAESAVHCNVV